LLYTNFEKYIVQR